MDFYYMPLSSPCRSVQMTAATLGLKLNLKFLDLFKGEHMTPEFLKINPQHCIPTLVDNGFSIWESRAIVIYLVEKYGKDDSLYPKDPQARALVNQRIFFDMTLYQTFRDYFLPQVYGKKRADPEKVQPIKNALGLLNTFLEGQKWACGDKMTIADLILVATIATFDVSAGVSFKDYPNIVKWYELCKNSIPGYETNQEGAEDYKKLFVDVKSI